MSPTSPDAFEHFAAECGLRITAEALYSAPRDVLHPPAESDQAFLVTIRTAQGEGTPLRLVFLSPLSDPEPPTHRDVLWWLAADAWALDEANGILENWAAGYGHSPDDPATAQLFDRHSRQVAALKTLLGKEKFDRLLVLHGAEVSRPGVRHLR